MKEDIITCVMLIIITLATLSGLSMPVLLYVGGAPLLAVLPPAVG